MRKVSLAILLVLVFLLSTVAIAYANPTDVTVTVKDETGSAVSGAVVQVFNSEGVKIAEGTTNESGIVVLDLPNATLTFFVKIAEGKYIIHTISYYTNTTSVTIDASVMNKATLETDATTTIKVTVVPLSNNATKVEFPLNATLYASESVNVTFPKEVVKAPFVVERFESVEVNGTEHTENTVSLDLGLGDYTVISHYKTYYTFTWTLETYLILLFIAVIVLLILFAFIKGAKTVTVKPKKYIKLRS